MPCGRRILSAPEEHCCRSEIRRFQRDRNLLGSPGSEQCRTCIPGTEWRIGSARIRPPSNFMDGRTSLAGRCKGLKWRTILSAASLQETARPIMVPTKKAFIRSSPNPVRMGICVRRSEPRSFEVSTARKISAPSGPSDGRRILTQLGCPKCRSRRFLSKGWILEPQSTCFCRS